MHQRSIPETLLLYTLSFSLIILVGGMATSFFTGSGKAIELGPLVHFIGRLGGWLSSSAQEASQTDNDPRSFTEIAQDTGEQLQERVQASDLLKPNPALQTRNPLLSVCDGGSILDDEPTITAMQADALKSGWQSGELRPQVDDAIADLGQPNCTLGDGKILRYLGPDLRMVDVHKDGDNAVLRFHNY